jgi:hypothetical protein
VEKMRLEDWLAVGFVVALMLLFITLGVVALTGSNKVEDTVLVRNPVDHTMISMTPLPQQKWGFKHCTPTNKDCGRLE